MLTINVQIIENSETLWNFLKSPKEMMNDLINAIKTNKKVHQIIVKDENKNIVYNWNSVIGEL